MTSINSPWIVRRNPRERPDLRLFCLPHAGAGSVIYRDWHAALPNNIDVCAIEPPGRFARRKEPAIRDVKQFGEVLASVLGPYLDVPFAFFGYSLGALMAFECARALRRTRNIEPAYLIAAAHKAPQLRARRPPISHEPKAVFLRELERRYGPLEPAIASDPEMLDMVLNMMRVDLGMVEKYNYQEEAPFTCPMLVVGGAQDVSVSLTELDGWREQTSGGFRSYQLPGAHFFLRTCGAELRDLVREAITPIGAARQAIHA